MLRAWKMLCERNGVHLADVESFPFFDTNAAPNPSKARRALSNVLKLLSELRGLSVEHQVLQYAVLRDQLDDEVFDYFDLVETEKVLIRETVQILMPSIRPRSYQNLYTPSQRQPQTKDFAAYAETLATSMTEWRLRTGGKGRFEVKVVTNELEREGPLGIVRVRYRGDATRSATFESETSDRVIQSILGELRSKRITVVPSGEALQLLPDSQLWLGDSLYLVRLLNRRSWSVRQALRDAEQIVHSVQRRSAQAQRKERK
jgi:hypothetical protein